MKRALALLLLAALAGPAGAQNTNDQNSPSGPRGGPAPKSEYELQQEKRNALESAVALPALPRDGNLIEFWVSNSSTFRFFIDAASISVSDDLIVRYTLVARSASGVANVSYEGMRCSEGTYRVYAYAHDGKWAPREAEWKRIEPNTLQRWHDELRFRYFCANRRGALMSKEEGIDALRRGGHPGAMTRPGY